MSTWRFVVIGVLAACGGPQGDPGVTVTPIDGLATTEGGGTARFTVVLDRYPEAPVTIPIESSGTGEGTTEPASLMFTSANWDLPQAVTVRGLDDDAADGDVAYTVMTLPATSGDGGFAGLDADDVSLVNRDDDVAGFTITPTAGLTTSENGTDTEFSIRLTTRPGADVTLALTSSRPDEGTVAPGSLTFTTDGWDQPQTITISGVDDVMADGIRNYAIMTQPATSADPDYNGLDPADISVANLDNDTPGITVTPTTGLATSESGDTDTFTIVLDSKPRADVTINLSSSDPAEGTVSPAQLVFTPTSWLVARTVTVTGKNDLPAVDDGDRGFAIVTAAAISTDAGYSGRNADDVSVANHDNDDPGFTFSGDSLVTREAGAGDELFVRLDTRPSANVTLGFSTSDDTEGDVDPASVTFTPANWDQPRRIAIEGLDDDLDDGPIAYTVVTAAATSSDPSYAGLDPADFDAVNLDNDESEVEVTPTTGLATTEAGGTDSFTVVLTAEPTGTVTIPVSSTNPDEGTVSTPELTFTPGNWDTAQTVTVTGNDDDRDDGDQTFDIALGTATGGGYNVDPDDVEVTNSDDDSAGFVIVISPAGCGTGTATTIDTTETGGKDCFSIRLASEPTDSVTIDVSSNDTTEGTVAPASLTFTAGDWNTAKTVTVTGVDDLLLDGDRPYAIVLDAASSDDSGYDGLDPDDLPAINVGNIL
jgi:hypothetical protein